MSGSKPDSAAGCEPASQQLTRFASRIRPRQAGSLRFQGSHPPIQLASRDRGLLFALMKLFP